MFRTVLTREPTSKRLERIAKLYADELGTLNADAKQCEAISRPLDLLKAKDAKADPTPNRHRRTSCLDHDREMCCLIWTRH